MAAVGAPLAGLALVCAAAPVQACIYAVRRGKLMDSQGPAVQAVDPHG
jgi:hypothetical protein